MYALLCSQIKLESNCLTRYLKDWECQWVLRHLQVCYSMEGKDSPYGVENTNQAFWLTPEGHITRRA